MKLFHYEISWNNATRNPVTQKPENYLPLRPVHYHVLLVLAEGPLHPYALVKDIARRTEQAVRPGPASIHRTIRQLHESGLIEESDERPAPEKDDARRRYFRLTALGRDVARAETARLHALVQRAQRHLGDAR